MDVLSIDFSASIDIIMLILSFILLVWYIALINLHMLNDPYTPEMNPT